MEPSQTLKWKKQTAGSVGKCMWESWNLGSSFASDLLRGWQGFFRPTTRKVKKRQSQFASNIWLIIALFDSFNCKCKASHVTISSKLTFKYYFLYTGNNAAFFNTSFNEESLKKNEQSSSQIHYHTGKNLVIFGL